MCNPTTSSRFISEYAFHRNASQYLKHFPYMDLLPPQSDLLTALYFTAEELEAFKGTNIYGACNDRLRDWQAEWMQCREVINQHKPEWGLQFEWYVRPSKWKDINSRTFLLGQCILQLPPIFPHGPFRRPSSRGCRNCQAMRTTPLQSRFYSLALTSSIMPEASLLRGSLTRNRRRQ